MKYVWMINEEMPHLPRSTISPSLRTRISSAWITVDSRCATTMVVLSAQTLFRAAWMFLSVCVSNALVASSSRTIAGDFSSVRAMATRCFSPPLSFSPLSPTYEQFQFYKTDCIIQYLSWNTDKRSSNFIKQENSFLCFQNHIVNSIHFIQSCPISLWPILILFSHICKVYPMHVTPPNNLILLELITNNIRLRIWIMKLLTMQFSLLLCCLHFLSSKYSPQHLFFDTLNQCICFTMTY